MCGIAGIIGNNAHSYSNHLQIMVARLNHRGPDETGLFIYPTCVLGHTRLSIVDLSTGNQPMHSALSQKTIVFNGEIYGYQNIKQKIQNYPFQTTSDTEVILALYEQFGTDCLDNLPGMFSFAIWDEKKQELFAARDRFGEKPFFYCWGKNGEFIFASEIKAILATGLIEPELNLESVEHYLQFLYVHPYSTIYSNIHTLPPAHYLLLHEGTLSVCRYWELTTSVKETSIEEAIKSFKVLLEQAVNKQLIADVQVGAFLSGGLDSSTIVSIAKKFKPDIQTFSFGFNETLNELPYARSIAEKYDTKHFELTENDIDIPGILLQISDIYDEPFGDSSNIPTYLISKKASSYLKVILTGDGADELLAGYTWWYKPLMEQKNNLSSVNITYHFLHSILRFWVKFFKCGESEKNNNPISNDGKLNFFSKAYETRGRQFSNEDLRKICKFPLKDLKNLKCSEWPDTGTINDALMIDIENYLAGDILVKIDRASMANSLELRAPFLDVEFASFCLSLPYTLKITKNRDKVILREAFQEAWSEEIRNRKKQGFGSPIELWLKDPGVNKLMEEYLDKKTNKIFEILNFDEVQRFRKKNTYQTWLFLILSIWMERNSYKIPSFITY